MEIYTVNPYSPAYEAGLREGDIIKRIDGLVFRNIFDVYSYFLAKEVGDQVVVEFEREEVAMPPATIELGEKKTRYFGSKIEAYGGGWGTYDVTRYSSDITY
jgi:S1-C subfamily serine protease